MFLEAIKFKNGKAPLLKYHRQRIIDTIIKEKSRRDIQKEQQKILKDAASMMLFLISSLTPPSQQGVFKCRIVYNPYQPGHETIEFLPYQQESIKSLQLINENNIHYKRKYFDRSQIQSLYQKRGSADDILITCNSKITDTSYCNIVFFDGENWVTPDTPLLKGVMRTYLLNTKVIQEKPIQVKDLLNFEYFKLINALRSFHEAEKVTVKKILF